MRTLLLLVVIFAGWWVIGLAVAYVMIPLIPLFAIAAAGALLYRLTVPLRTRLRRHSIRV